MASALLLLGGCDDAKYGVIRHAVYFTDAEDSPQKSVVIEESGGRIPITVRSVGRVESDVTVHCVVDPAVLDDYNAKAGTNFALLPEAIYTVPESFLIPQGQAVSIAGVIDVGAYTEQMKNSGSQFALPLRLRLLAAALGALGLSLIVRTAVQQATDSPQGVPLDI